MTQLPVYVRPKYPLLTRRFLNLDCDQELPACADFPPPWRCEFFFSLRANNGLVEYQKIDPLIRERVVREFIERNYLGHESYMEGAMTFDDYLLLRRLMEERNAI